METQKIKCIPGNHQPVEQTYWSCRQTKRSSRQWTGPKRVSVVLSRVRSTRNVWRGELVTMCPRVSASGPRLNLSASKRHAPFRRAEVGDPAPLGPALSGPRVLASRGSRGPALWAPPPLQEARFYTAAVCSLCDMLGFTYGVGTWRRLHHLHLSGWPPEGLISWAWNLPERLDLLRLHLLLVIVKIHIGLSIVTTLGAALGH